MKKVKEPKDKMLIPKKVGGRVILAKQSKMFLLQTIGANVKIIRTLNEKLEVKTNINFMGNRKIEKMESDIMVLELVNSAERKEVKKLNFIINRLRDELSAKNIENYGLQFQLHGSLTTCESGSSNDNERL